MSGLSELGPVLPPRSVVYDRAHEIAALAQIACDCAVTGPGGDLARAVRLLGRIAALAGPGPAPEGES